MYVCLCRFVGVLLFVLECYGECFVVDNVSGMVFEVVVFRCKVYWMVMVILWLCDDIVFVVDGKEIIEFDWFFLEDVWWVVC